MINHRSDKIFILLAGILVGAGLFIFASASLGILAKNKEVFYGIVSGQIIFGLIGGIVAFLFFSHLPYKFWKKYGFWVFVVSLALTAFVFIPGLGFEHGGAKRWIDLFGISFQPSEILKLGVVVYLAALFSSTKKGVENYRYGLLPLLGVMAPVSLVMLLQPDTGTFIIMLVASLAIYFAAGAPVKHLLVIFVIGIIGFSMLVIEKPYLKDRITTFINPETDPLGSSYQIEQSLIAIGSGELWGRGLGQSVQKFNYLPEPAGDSVFAVIGEELGFIGAATIVLLFLLFAFRGLKIAIRAPDQFSTYLVVGIMSVILSQSFINIASLVGIFPLTGVPLAFISHGGTALFVVLAEVGIVVNVSSYAKRS